MPLLTELENLFRLELQIFRAYGAANDSMPLPYATLAGAIAKIELSAVRFHGKLWPLCSK
jgi:hypothetical protein